MTNSPHTTNRILEIPQNIQVSVNGYEVTISGLGTYADGTNVEFSLTRTLFGYGTVGKKYILYNNMDATFSGQWWIYEEGVVYYQNTQPTTSSQYAYWFNPNAKTFKVTQNTGSTWVDIPLPYCEVELTSSGWKVTRVFNGFGYLGYVAFALPNVVLQLADGRDEDGTAKSIIYTTQNVSLQNFSGYGSGKRPNCPVYFQTSNDTIRATILRWQNVATLSQFDTSQNDFFYDSESNRTGQYYSGVFNFHSDWIYLGAVDLDSTNITDLRITNTTETLLTSNASTLNQAGRSYLSGLGMPDITHHVNLTYGASGTSYISPANGYFAIEDSFASGGYVQLRAVDSNDNEIYRVTTSGSNFGGAIILPVINGTKVVLNYGGGINSNVYFRFIYAIGEN